LNPGPKQKNPFAPTTELYNLGSDPRETTDVAANHPDIVAKLSAIAKREHTTSKIWPVRALDGGASD
jgi:arylsulfatase